MRYLKLVFTILILSCILVSPISAEANTLVHSSTGGSGGTGGSGTSGWGATPLKWVMVSDSGSGFDLIDRNNPASGTPYHIEPGYSAAWVVYTGNPTSSLKKDWCNFSTANISDPTNNSNNWGASPEYLPSDFRSAAVDAGYIRSSGEVVWKNSNGKWLDAIQVQLEITTTHTDIAQGAARSSLYHLSFNGSGELGRQGHSLEYIYNNPLSSKSYAYNTEDQQQSFNSSVVASDITITKLETYTTTNLDPTKRNIVVDYRVNYISPSVDLSKSYQVEKPVMAKNIFKPYSLNEPGDHTYNGDISEFKGTPVNQALDADVSTSYKTLDNGAIPAVDLNIAIPFTFNIKNNQLSIPTDGPFGITFLTSTPGEPVILAMEENKQYYYNPTFALTSSANSLATSLENNGREVTGGNAYSESYGWKAGSFNFRAIKAGQYSLNNDSAYKDFLVMKYNTGITYKYGQYFWGTATARSMDTPIITLYQKDTKGYTDSVSDTIVQPVLKGNFVVKSVGGYRK